MFSSCREVRTCENSLEAELLACRQGLDLAVHRTSLSILVELDSVEAVHMLTTHVADRSQHRTLVEEIRSLATSAEREILFSHCRRSQNKVSHELAVYGRSTPRTAVWLYSGMDFDVNLCAVV